jgi:hypothetical protein
VKKLLLTVFGTIIIVSLASASDWRQETNKRYGFMLSYPADFIPERLPENGDGRRYHSPDGQVSLAASAFHLASDNDPGGLEAFWAKELSERGQTVTYKLKRANWYVISGVNPNGFEFYHKAFFYPTYQVEFEITYPHSQNARWNKVVERLSREFVPALPNNGQYDR